MRVGRRESPVPTPPRSPPEAEAPPSAADEPHDQALPGLRCCLQRVVEVAVRGLIQARVHGSHDRRSHKTDTQRILRGVDVQRLRVRRRVSPCFLTMQGCRLGRWVPIPYVYILLEYVRGGASHVPRRALGEMGPGQGPRPGLRCWIGLANTPKPLAHHTLDTPACRERSLLSPRRARAQDLCMCPDPTTQ